MMSGMTQDIYLHDRTLLWSHGTSISLHLFVLEFIENSNFRLALWMMLCRAKRMGIDWIAAIGVDEFITVYHAEKPDDGNLPLTHYFDKLGESNDYASIALNSIPMVVILPKKIPKRNCWLITFTQKMYGKVWTRSDFIDINSSWMSSLPRGSLHFIWFENCQERLWFQKIVSFELTHYKTPKKGMYRSGKTKIMKHTALRDHYPSAIKSEIDGKWWDRLR